MTARRLPFHVLAALLLAGTFLAVAISLRAGHEAADRTAAVEASQAAGALRASFASAVASVDNLGALFDASSGVTRAEFAAFARPLLGRGGLSLVVWTPRVGPAERAAYERRHAPIIARNIGRRLGHAAATAYPVTYVAARPDKGVPIGLDIATAPERRFGLRLAARTGVTLATHPMRVLAGSEDGIILFQAIYRGGAPPRSIALRQAALTGYVGGVLTLRDLLRAARSAVPRDAVLRVTDGLVLVTGPARPLDGASETIEVAGREWTVSVAHHEPDMTLPITVLLAGLALTGFALVLAEVIARRDRFARRAVESATAKLRASRRDYRALAENSPDVVARYDRDHRCIYINAAAERATGLPPHAFVGRTTAEAGTPAHAAQALETALDAVFAGEEAEIEFGVPEVDGPTWIQSRLAPERGPDGTVEHALVLSRDITRQREVEAALREGEERYRSLVAAMGDGVIVLDADGRVTSCNRAAESILGLPADRMLGRAATDPRWRAVDESGAAVPADAHPGMPTLRTGAPERDRVMGVHTPDGELTWISISTEPLDTAVTGDDAAVVCCFVDVSARLAAEREQAALRRVATLVATQAHPNGVFAAVSREAARLLEAEAATILRLEPSGASGTAVGSWSRGVLDGMTGGGALALSPETVAGTVAATGASGRMEAAEGRPVAGLPGRAYRWAVASPIVVDGRAWGALIAGGTGPARPSPRAEERLERFAELVALAIVSADARSQLATLAATDHVTGLWNRRAFDERLSAEVGRALRHDRPLALVSVDLDHFKDVNDTYGHAVGDSVLAELARRLRDCARHGETVARVGGEEFAWILPESDIEAGLAAAERARAAIASEPFPVAGRLTVSAGVCDLRAAGSGDELVRLADAALYEAKELGRDRVVPYGAIGAHAPG